MCWKLYSLLKCENFLDVFCGPLSLKISSGMPYCEKTDFRTEMILVEVVSVGLITSGKREKSSDMMRYSR